MSSKVAAALLKENADGLEGADAAAWTAGLAEVETALADVPDRPVVSIPMARSCGWGLVGASSGKVSRVMVSNTGSCSPSVG